MVKFFVIVHQDMLEDVANNAPLVTPVIQIFLEIRVDQVDNVIPLEQFQPTLMHMEDVNAR